VGFGGLKLSVTLDSLFTANASDLRNGNYSVIVPPQWAQYVGKHTLTINAGGKPTLVDALCGAPPLAILQPRPQIGSGFVNGVCDEC